MKLPYWLKSRRRKQEEYLARQVEILESVHSSQKQIAGVLQNLCELLADNADSVADRTRLREIAKGLEDLRA